MRVQVAALVITAFLAACSPPAQAPAGSEEAGNAVSSTGGSPASIQPGQYRTTVSILEMNIPGIKTTTINAQPTTSEDCVTSDDVAELTNGSLLDADEGESCTRNNMTAANGHIEGSATCTGSGGQRSMHMTGSYTSTHVDMDVTATGQAPGGAGEMSQHIRVVTDRIGACTTGTQ